MKEVTPKEFLNGSVQDRELHDYVALSNISSKTDTVIGKLDALIGAIGQVSDRIGTSENYPEGTAQQLDKVIEILEGGYIPPTPPTPEKVVVTLIAPDGEGTLYGFGTREVEIEKGGYLNADSAGEDYNLTGYFIDSALTQAFDYEHTPINEETILYVAGKPMMMSSDVAIRLNGESANITALHFVLAGGEPQEEPTQTWDASDGGTKAVTAKMYADGSVYFVAREGATHIWMPDGDGAFTAMTNLKSADGFKYLHGLTNMNNFLSGNTMMEDYGDIADLDTSNVTILSRVFHQSQILGTLDISKWDVSKATDYMNFCSRTIGNGHLVAQNWTIAENASLEQFAIGNTGKTNSLQSIDCSGWTFGGNNIAKFMFAENNNIESINISGWDFSKLTTVDQFIKQDYNLKELILGDGNYINYTTYAKHDGYSGIYHMMSYCYNLTKFNNTGDEKKDHTLVVRVPNAAGMNCTQAFACLGADADTPFYLDFDFNDKVYEEAGEDDVSLVIIGSRLFSASGKAQYKIFGNYNDKWGGAVIGTTHNNRVVSTTTLSLSAGTSESHNGVVYKSKLQSVIMDRFIPNTTISNDLVSPICTNLEWVLVNPDLTEDEQAKFITYTGVTDGFTLKGYYDGGVYDSSHMPLMIGYSKIATTTTRGYLTANPAYIDTSKVDPTVIGGTLTELKAAVADGTAKDRFPIGTIIADTFGESSEAPLIVGHYLDETNNTNYGGAEGVFVFRRYCEPLKQTFGDKPTYDTSDIRTYLQNDYLNACSDSLKSVISDITLQWGGYNAKPTGTVTDKVFLMSIRELGYTPTDTTSAGELWDFWNIMGIQPTERIAYDNTGTTAQPWWTRSKADSTQVRIVRESGSAGSLVPTRQFAVRPAFFISKEAVVA